MECQNLDRTTLTLYHTIPGFNHPVEEHCENIIGKGENTTNEHYPHFFTHIFFSKKMQLFEPHSMRYLFVKWMLSLHTS